MARHPAVAPPAEEIDMTDETVLTEDELAFIRQLMLRGASNGEGPTGFRVDGGAKSNELLLQLAARAELTLEARSGDFRMSFPLRIREDELHSLNLQLSPPVIYEQGPTPRAWRLHLDEPLPLLERGGEPSALQVRELSSHSLLVETDNRRKPPKSFHLQLALPDDAPMEIDARRVRELKDGQAAYEVEFAGQKDAERIRHFLYQQHKRLHADPLSEAPADLV